ncbi:hypothetical protein AB0300_18430, partial [Microbacterium sp. NPDC078814]|uniref:hypothetical protein n=1 Tax=Microbacterium sp. NPDC078814 TaxID=3154767 RepID=UPI00344E9EF9
YVRGITGGGFSVDLTAAASALDRSKTRAVTSGLHSPLTSWQRPLPFRPTADHQQIGKPR